MRRFDRISFAASLIDSSVEPKLETSVYGVIITCVNHYLHTISSVETFVGILSAGLPAHTILIIAGTDPDTVVLQASVNIIGFCHIHIHRVKLTY